MYELDGDWFACLPARLRDELRRRRLDRLDELRLRAGGACGVVFDRRETRLDTRLDGDALGEIVKRLCGGSLYAYADSIREGFITLPSGVRVGLCGRAVTERGGITAVYDIGSLCIRIPHRVSGIGERIARLIQAERVGVLIYSSPGVGKTTLLRALIERLASGSSPMRLAVIDTRGELSPGQPPGLTVDWLCGYPRGVGIEIAARVLNPELIVCDEIGADLAEAGAIRAAHNCGVPLLASAHASALSELRAKSGIALLCEGAIFGCFVGLERTSGPDYRYRIARRGDVG